MERPLSADPSVAAADASARRFTELLRALPNPDARAIGEWTVRDVAAHMAGFLPTYLAILRGEGSPLAKLEDLSRLNARTLAAVDERDLTKLASRIDALFDEALSTAAGASAESVVPWHGQLPLRLSTAWAALAGEPLVHGYDIARAVGKPWVIPAHEARAVLMGLLPLMPHYVDVEAAAKFRGRFDLRLRGAPDARAVLVVEDARLAIEQPNGARVDCHISADPAAFLLVAYRRVKPLRPALTGKILAWGRRPLLAFQLARIFRNQ